MGTGRDFEEMLERGVMGLWETGKMGGVDLCMILSEIEIANSNRHNLRLFPFRFGLLVF